MMLLNGLLKFVGFVADTVDAVFFQSWDYIEDEKPQTVKMTPVVGNETMCGLPVVERRLSPLTAEDMSGVPFTTPSDDDAEYVVYVKAYMDHRGTIVPAHTRRKPKKSKKPKFSKELLDAMLPPLPAILEANRQAANDTA